MFLRTMSVTLSAEDYSEVEFQVNSGATHHIIKSSENIMGSCPGGERVCINDSSQQRQNKDTRQGHNIYSPSAVIRYGVTYSTVQYKGTHNITGTFYHLRRLQGAASSMMKSHTTIRSLPFSLGITNSVYWTRFCDMAARRGKHPPP